MPGVADLAILLVLLIGVYVGVARGIYAPLATEGSFLAAILVVSHLHTGIDSFLPVGIRLVVSAVLVFIPLPMAPITA